MQRRAAALYAIFFLIVAVGAYAVIGVAQEPGVSIESPEHSVSEGQTFTVDGQEYNVSSLEGGTNQGDDARSAELTWTNESARWTETWQNDSTVTLDDTEFHVLVGSGEDPNSAVLREVQTLDENLTTTEVDGTTYVVLGEGDDRRLVSESRYLQEQHGSPETREISEGDTLEIPIEDGRQTATVSSISSSGVEFEWEAPRNHSTSFSEGENVTLSDNQYVAHFPDNSTLMLSSDVSGYHDQQAVITRYHDRINGLWAVAVLAVIAAILLIGMAYMPSRY